MLIILEGIDGAGKTTLAEELINVGGHDSVRWHRGPLRGDALKEYEWALRNYDPGAGQLVVADRWHVGELAYGPLYRGRSQLTPAMHRHVELVLDRLGALKVIVTAPYDSIVERLAARGETFLRPEHTGLMWDFYNSYAEEQGWRTVQSDHDPHKLITDAHRLTRAAFWLHQYGTYIGPHAPRYLLLGDARGKPDPHRPRYPWSFVPYPNTSGAFLFKSLESVGLRDYGVANACEEHVAALWRLLGRPQVVCLGKNADEATARANVTHGTVEHPQYVRRFRHDRFELYGQEIKEALQ